MSGKLSCSAANCVNNVNGLCSANTIEVDGPRAQTSSGTECNTFAQKGFKNAVMNLTNMNLPGEIRQIFSKDSVEMNPSIKCRAVNCIHNINEICNAKSVMIYGPGARSSDDTECQTFKE